MAGLDTVQIRNGAAIIDTSGLNIAISQSIAHSAELGDNAIDGGLTKIGSGVLTLSGTNTYTGATSINEGVLSISSTAALPGWNTNSSYSVANGATLAVTNTVDDATVATLLGTTNFAAGAAIGFDTAAGNRTYSATIANTSQGALGVTKAGGNSLTLNAANTYSGTTSVLSGELLIQNSSSLGTTAAGTVVTTGARLVLAGGITVSDEPLTLSGNGTDFFGALRSSSGVNQWTGPITIAANDTRIGASAGSTMEVSGVISSGSNAHLVTFRPVDTTATVRMPSSLATSARDMTFLRNRTLPSDHVGNASSTGAAEIDDVSPKRRMLDGRYTLAQSNGFSSGTKP
jgi:autotransporter-associated beta strand protein